MKRVSEIEDALSKAIKFRVSGCDIVHADGVRYVRIYHHGCPSQHGGSGLAAEINLTGLAVDIERALS